MRAQTPESEKPPMVLAMARRGWAFRLILGVVLTAEGARASNRGAGVSHTIGFALLLGGLALAVLSVFMLIEPGRLEITRGSFFIIVPFRRVEVRFERCSEFHVTRVARTDMVAYDLFDESGAVRVKRRLMRNSTRYLPRDYGWKATALAELMNAYRSAASPAIAPSTSSAEDAS